MKLTKTQLREIIREELLNEASVDMSFRKKISNELNNQIATIRDDIQKHIDTAEKSLVGKMAIIPRKKSSKGMVYKIYRDDLFSDWYQQQDDYKIKNDAFKIVDSNIITGKLDWDSKIKPSNIGVELQVIFPALLKNGKTKKYKGWVRLTQLTGLK